MNPIEKRLLEVIPENFPVQKCKCKKGRAEGSISCDLTVQDVAFLPPHLRSVHLVNLKGLTAIAELTKTPFHTDGVLLSKKLKISDADLDALKTAWSVHEVFDFRNKETKKEERERKKAFQREYTGDLNKVVLNPNYPSGKKAKITFSDFSLSTVLTLAEKKSSLMGSVTSWKFAIDFQKDPFRAEFSRFAEFVRAIEAPSHVKIKKCSLSPEQTTQIMPL
jgi:hypothetical protein